MRKTILFSTISIVILSVVSCKNVKSGSESIIRLEDEELVDAARVLLEDNVVASVTDLARQYADLSDREGVTGILLCNLSEEESLVKPDFLFEPSQANVMLSRLQKINTLAILVVERPVRLAYNLSVKDTDEAIAKLTFDLNYPIEPDDLKAKSPDEIITMEYESCKEREDIMSFWQFSIAVQNELTYLISRDPDRFFDNVSDEQFESFIARRKMTLKAARDLAPYDREISEILELMNQYRIVEEYDMIYDSADSARERLRELAPDCERLRSRLISGE